jgi:hypothetical protein
MEFDGSSKGSNSIQESNDSNSVIDVDVERPVPKRKVSRALVDIPDSPFLIQNPPTANSKPTVSPPTSTPSPSSAPFKSDIASRVASFLPLLQSANEELERKIKAEGKDAVNVEVLDPDAQSVIQLNLLLGVLQPKEDGPSLLLPGASSRDTSSPMDILLPHQEDSSSVGDLRAQLESEGESDSSDESDSEEEEEG